MPSGEPAAGDEELGQATELHQQGRLTEAEQAYRQILAREPRHFIALHRLAIVALQQGRLDEALRGVDAALQVEPRAEPTLLNKGTILYGLGRAEEALAVYRALLDINPASVDAHFNIANALLATDRAAQAAESFARAAVLRPDDAEVRRRHAEALARAGRPADALASLDAALALAPEALRLHYERAALLLSLRRYQDAAAAYEAVLARSPGDTVAMNNRGLALLELGRLQEALASWDAAVAIKPEDLDLWYNRGNALARLEQSDAALASYDRVLAGNPDHTRALTNRANLLRTAGRAEEALASYQRALALAPGDAATHTNMGNALRHLNRHSEALAAHERALAIDAGLVEALINRGIALKDLDRLDEALASYARALALAPDHAEALYNQGLARGLLNRHEQALASHERALAADPNHRHALGAIADAALRICDWARMERLRPELERRIGEGRPVVGPFTLIGYADDPALQLKCTRAYMADRFQLAMPALWRRTGPGPRLRIAYLSADFQRHATAFLMAELIELHDRSRFEVVGVSWGKDDGSTTRTRLVGAFDRFLDVGASSDLDVARRLAADEVSIAVDLKGLTGSNRIGILSHRPAPIQVAYLGYPATSGASFIDYVLADPVVLPLDQQQQWTEAIVHLPGCYQANDRRRAVPTAPPSRAANGLPDTGFVFCSFNNSWKITAPVFDIWMRLLHHTPGGVLWLIDDNEAASRSLRRAAAQRGVAPERLIFAPRAEPEAHLARHRLADLFLDTLPYNAHTTASDALWMATPVLTCPGKSFAARVAASLLQAVGMPELVCRSLEDYEQMALRLAREPAMLAEIKARLETGRSTARLFDTPRLARDIEAAFTTMWEIHQRGEAPRSFAVPPPA
jgi:protein O-GlcNAc transferase